MNKNIKRVSRSKRDYANVSTRAMYMTLGAVVGTVMITGTALTATNASADITDNLTINLEESCTMSSTGGNSHNATMLGGQYIEGIGTTTVNVQCTDQDGFAVYAVGYTGLEYGNNRLRGPKNTEQSGYHEIESRVFGGYGNTDSGWSMHLSAVDGAYKPTITDEGGSGSTESGEARYAVVPNQWTKVAYYNGATDWTDVGSPAEGSTFTTTYAVYANPSQHPGTYQGKVRYTLVHPENAETPESVAYDNEHEEKWLYMQDVAEWGDMLVEGEETTVKDNRDGKKYTVARLADGNIWMTQNLDLDITPQGATNYYDGAYEGVYTPFTNENTDLGWNGTDYDTASWTPSSATLTDVNDWQGDQYTTPESYDPGYGVYDIDGATDDHYLLGNYYNWTAAIAMNNSSNIGTDEGLYPVEQSICPKGWTLPRAGEGQDTFKKMFESYGLKDSTNDKSFLDDLLAPRFALSGNLLNSSNGIEGRGERAYYWSAVYRNNEAYSGQVGGSYDSTIRYIDSAKEDVGSGSNGAGYSIRCVARPVSATTQGIAH